MKVFNGIVVMEGLVFRLDNIQYLQKIGETILRLGFTAKHVDITWAPPCDGRMGVVQSMRTRDEEYKKLAAYMVQQATYKTKTLTIKTTIYGLN